MTDKDVKNDPLLCNLVNDFLDGELDDQTNESFISHLDNCDNCRTFIESMNAINKLIGTEKEETLDDYADMAIRKKLQHECAPSLENDDDTIYDLNTAARLLKISREEMKQLAQEIPAFSIGGRLRIRKSTLRAWIEKQETIMSWNRPLTSRKIDEKILPFQGGKTA